MAPTLNPPPPPPPPPTPNVTIKYTQLNDACTFYSDVLASNAIASAGAGDAFVFFGIAGIENDGNAPFSVDLANLFVPPDVFASPIGSDLECHSTHPGPRTRASWSQRIRRGISDSCDRRLRHRSENLDTTIASFFLSYSLNPSDPSATDPQVTFVRTNNPAVTTSSILRPLLALT